MARSNQPSAVELDDRVDGAGAPGPSGAVVPWLDPEEMRAWRGLIEMTGDVTAALDAELLGEFGLSEGDYGVLVSLSEAPDRRMRMCDLAARMHLSPSGLTRRLDGLVRDGLVVREPSRDDRRVTLAVLTDEGFARLEQAAPVHVAGVRRQLFDHLTRAQIRQLGAAFDHLRELRAGIGDCGSAAGGNRERTAGDARGATR